MELSENALGTTYQEFIYKRSYARWIEDEKRRENWSETVDRYKEFFLKRVPKSKRLEFTKACESVFKLKIMPSMRCLWTAGKALEKDNIAGFNCSYITINKVKAFSEVMYILLNGTGVGFSVEKQYVDQLPSIPNKLKETDEIIIFADSKLGWAEGYLKFIKCLYSGKIPNYDLTKIRPEGSRLKTFGGKASGPEPVRQLLEYTKNVFIENKGNKLDSLQCHDLCCYIANLVVSGGVRRSACISLTDLVDDKMRRAKLGEFWNQNSQRSLANISVAYKEKPDVVTFLQEWLSLIQNKSGERGIFNREGSKFVVSQIGRRDCEYEWGTNPCQPEWATVLTQKGIRSIKDINVGSIVWSEDGWVNVTNKLYSGIKPVFGWKTNAGIFYGTKEHKIIDRENKVEVQNAETIDILRGTSSSGVLFSDVIMDGLVLGDGSVHKASNNLTYLFIGEDDHDYFNSEISNFILKHRSGLKETAYEIKTNIKQHELPRTFNRKVPERYKYGSSFTVMSFLRGLFSANGSIIESAGRITLKTSSEKIVEDVQLMLSSVGIKSYKTENKKHRVEFKNGVYECKKSWDVNITTDIHIFYQKIGFLQKYKNEKLGRVLSKKGKSVYSRPKDKISFDINDIEYTSTEDVYNITVDGINHTYWSGGCNISNCNEVILRPQEFCNLSEVIVSPEDKKQDLLKKVRQATILGCIQSTLTKFNFIGREWKKNTEEERLLGVSLTGLCDHPILKNRSKEARILLVEMKQVAIDTAEEWSKVLEINMPTAITCIKPSGTVSQLTDCSSGLHPRFAPFYIRRIRVDKTDALGSFLIDKGIKWNPEVGQTEDNMTTIVLEFPIKSPDSSLMRDEVTALNQLDYWLMLQKCWCEHKPSITVYVKDNEWIEVGNWVYKNWMYVSGVAFLPYDNNVYQLAPYEEIDEDTYNDLVSNFPKIDLSELSDYEVEDNTEGAREFACVGNACEI